MPKVIVETDLAFEQQLKDLLFQLGIKERFKTLQAVKAAVRQYRPLPDYWLEGERGEFKCVLSLASYGAVTLTIYEGQGIDGVPRIMIKRIMAGEEEMVKGKSAIPLLI